MKDTAKYKHSSKDIIINFINALVVIAAVIILSVVLGVTAVKDSYVHQEEASDNSEKFSKKEAALVTSEVTSSVDEKNTYSDKKEGMSVMEDPVYNCMEYGKLEKKEKVPDNYFDDAVFIGDSRTVSLMNQGYISSDNTFAVNGISHMEFINHIFTDITTGKTGKIHEILAERKPAKIFVALGINGVAYVDTATFMSTYDVFIKNLKAACPDAVIVIQSMLPVNEKTYDGSNEHITNTLIDNTNDELLKYALDNKLYFLDFSDALKNPDNNTKPEFDFGDGLHFNHTANDVIYDNMCRYGIK